MSEPLMGFDSNRKWRVSVVNGLARAIWTAMAASPRVTRRQWMSIAGEAIEALATVAATSDDQWSRAHAVQALDTIKARTGVWVK